jgi:alpha-tubulin suppressor-like RCC1 family protein/tRNA A-37 threonylcarbamoyl transferase component Bud32
MSVERTPAALPALEAEYWILGEIGRGGTAIVYLARHRATGQEVAIKLIRAKYLEDEEAMARFAREARFVAQLDHPNVVGVHRVLDLGPSGIALVMAHVNGRTLKQVIKDEHPLAPDFVVRILREVASALSAAHGMGIIHRDVKPENIFIDDDGRALLADFGVARSMSGDTQLTMHGVAIGTPSYMAPEQIDGGELDGRGDIYSLGLVAWEMFTGHRPWEGESLYAVLYHQRHHELPDVREMRPDVSDEMADVIAGAIEKEPSARWQSMDELIAALDGAAPSRSAKAHVPVSTETVRFARPTTRPSNPVTDVVPLAAPASSEPVAPAAFGDDVGSYTPGFVGGYFTADELEEVHPARRRRFSRRQLSLAVAGIVGVIALGFVATALEGRSDAPRAARTSATRATSSGEIARAPAPSAALADSLADSLGDSLADSLAVGAGPGALPDSLSVALAIAPPAGGDTSGASPSAAGRAPDAPIGVVLDARRPPAPSTSIGAIVPAPRPSPQASPPAVPPSLSVAAAIGPAPTRPRVSIVAGGLHTCLVAADGRTFCWGGNDEGQLGTGGNIRLSTPAAVGADLRFSAVAPGLAHSCAIARGGALWCWGENDHGQLGDRTLSSHAAPSRSAAGHAFRSIAAGAAHTCGVDTDGVAWCWGSDAHGQLGDGGMLDRSTPVAVAGNSRFLSLDVGWNFTCGLEASGRAKCWGDNSAGQLGDGTTSDRRQPTAVQGNIEFKAITAGSAHTCGVTPGGEAYCWGRNASGELGDGSTAPRTTPVRVRSDEKFVSIAAGAVHTCAVAVDGEAWCWGRNTYGQLGNGGTSDSGQPVRVAGGHTFTSVRAFGSHTCGATASGEAFCWGYNSDGQLGDGTRTHRTRPVYVERPGG